MYALPLKPCGVDATLSVNVTVKLSSPMMLVCAVSLGSKNAVILPDQLLSVAMLMTQEPLAPNGVTSFTAPFSDNVHLEALLNVVDASTQLAPTPDNALIFFLPSYGRYGA